MLVSLLYTRHTLNISSLVLVQVREKEDPVAPWEAAVHWEDIVQQHKDFWCFAVNIQRRMDDCASDTIAPLSKGRSCGRSDTRTWDSENDMAIIQSKRSYMHSIARTSLMCDIWK
jgi:hypothetical protein